MSEFDDYQAARDVAREIAGDAATDAETGTVRPLIAGGWEFRYLTREGVLLARVVVDADNNATLQPEEE